MCIFPGVSGKQCFLDVINHFMLLQSYQALFHEDSLSLREECCDRNVLFGADHSTVFCSLHIDKLCVCGGVCLCVNCHLLQVEASLMRTERCSYVQVQQ